MATSGDGKLTPSPDGTPDQTLVESRGNDVPERATDPGRQLARAIQLELARSVAHRINREAYDRLKEKVEEVEADANVERTTRSVLWPILVIAITAIGAVLGWTFWSLR